MFYNNHLTPEVELCKKLTKRKHFDEGQPLHSEQGALRLYQMTLSFNDSEVKAS